MNREGRSYRSQTTSVVILIVKSKRLSSATSRHEALILEVPDDFLGARSIVGHTVVVDEVPADPWDKEWEELST